MRLFALNLMTDVRNSSCPAHKKAVTTIAFVSAHALNSSDYDTVNLTVSYGVMKRWPFKCVDVLDASFDLPLDGLLS